MPLKPCRECGAEVSTSANVCPHCGVRSPVPGGTRRGVGCVIILITVGIIGLAYLSNGTNKPESDLNKPPEDLQITQCRTDWTKCTDNEQVVEKYSGWSKVTFDCKMQANKQARHGSPSWSWVPFGRYRGGDNYVTSGIAFAIDEDVQFQNMFGAKVNSRVVCTYGHLEQ